MKLLQKNTIILGMTFGVALTFNSTNLEWAIGFTRLASLE